MTDTEISELHEKRDDPEDLEQEPASIRVRRAATEVVSFRVPSAEFDQLRAVAEEHDESLSQFIRGAIQMRLEGLESRGYSVIEDIDAAARKLLLHAGVPGSGSQVHTTGGPYHPPPTQNLTSSEGVCPKTLDSKLPLDWL